MHMTDERKAWLAGYCRRLRDAKIETERLCLRPFEESDLQDFFLLMSDREMCRMSGETAVRTMEEAGSALSDLLGQYQFLCRTFAIVQKADGRVIGHFDLGFYPFLEMDEALRRQSGVSLSFALAGDCRGKGYMTELLGRMLRWFFLETSLDFVNCGHFDFNHASEALQKKMGFQGYITHAFEANGETLLVREHLLTRTQYFNIVNRRISTNHKNETEESRMENNKRPESMERITTKALAQAFIDEQLQAIKRQVGSKKVLLALSGGVDSSVVAALLIRAIGKNLVCVHVNHGLLRKGEPEQVIKVFRDEMDANLVYVDAVDRFLDKLAGVSDPEQKRKIIGAEFIRVFEEEARKQEGIEFLAQGTIYPDILESVGVKAHHNVGGLPEDLQFELVEPVKFLYKDEVRMVGSALGLPDNMVYRQPFPGPGLGVRCVGAITRDRLEALREADAIVREEIGKLPETPWQYFCAIPDFQSTGIKYVDGKGIRYMGWAVVIRAVNTVDAVAATVPEIPFSVLCTIRDRIIATVPGVNRVLWDISEKPVATIEWE